MPQSIVISEVEIKYLKTALESKMGYAIIDTNDCQRVSHFVKESTGYLISYNTLRRLFRIIPTKSGVSLHSLNLLTEALGYRSWMDLKALIYDYKIAHRNHLIQSFSFKKEIHRDAVLNIITQLQLEDWEDAYWLKGIVKLAIELEDYQLLKSIFLFPFKIDLTKEQDKLYFGLQDIYFELPHNKKIVDLLQKNLKDSPLIQFIFVECYVNEAALDGYFGKLLDPYITVNAKHPLPALFYNLLMCQQHFNKVKDKKQAILFFQQAEKIYKKLDSEKVSSILKGRLAAWEWILYAKDNFYKEITAKLITQNDWSHFNVFFHRLCHEYSPGGHYHTFETYPGKLNSGKLSFFAERITAHENLQAAVHYYLMKEEKLSLEWFKKVDPFNFDIAMLQWYNSWYLKLEKVYKKKL